MKELYGRNAERNKIKKEKTHENNRQNQNFGYGHFFNDDSRNISYGNDYGKR